ncbi:MAG: UDP-N-acetylglucosamine acyltransferase [Lentimonas sp.]|jgi:UDP-N-acetylglucosamine acyltransferase
MDIHPSAIISESALIGKGTLIGAGALIEDGVVVGQNCKLAAYVVLRKGTVLGDAVTVDSFAVIGGEPQSLSFDSSIVSGVKIGDKVTLREGCTVSRATVAGTSTTIGNGCYLMAKVHVAHDCVISNGVVLCNNVMLGEHVRVGEQAFLSGGVAVHQHCRIGTYAMVADLASISADVPPYVMAGERNAAQGLNTVGLERGGFSRPELSDLKRCYRAVYFGAGNLKSKAEAALREHEFARTAVGARFLSFFESGQRGFILAGPEID